MILVLNKSIFRLITRKMNIISELRPLKKCSNDIKSMNYRSTRVMSGKDVKTSVPEVTSEEGLRHANLYSSVKYTSSDAHLKHKAYQNFRWSEEEVKEVPRYERPILVISAAIFFIYFGYLREPNDIDHKLGADLFELVPDLELPLIEVAIQDAERIGNDTTLLKQRLEELKSLKKEVENRRTDSK